LFGVGIILVAVMTRMRGFMNLHVRLFGVDRVIEQDYQHIAKFGSGKLLQIVHSGMESYSYLIYE
jgi:6-phosphogluconate dehydrogenase (decarboxylating)